MKKPLEQMAAEWAEQRNEQGPSIQSDPWRAASDGYIAGYRACQSASAADVTLTPEQSQQFIANLVASAVAETREQCAKVCEGQFTPLSGPNALAAMNKCAAAIRGAK